MSSNPGDANRQAAQYPFSPPEVGTPLEEVSDVESFSRTVPNIEDEDEESEELASGVNGGTEALDEADEVDEADEDGDDTIHGIPGAIEPEKAPSVQESLLSSPASGRPSSRNSTLRIRRGSLKPFDRRFSGFLSPSPSSSRTLSPAFRPSHSRHSSLASTITPGQDETDTPQPPWEVVRWTKLKKITGQVFSEIGKRNFGRPTVVVIGATIAMGTSKGLTLVFDYHQNLVATIGLGTKAVESGAVTALAISADHTTVASGHVTGHIFTWDIARPAKPFLHILPLAESQLEHRRSDGHVSESSVVHISFLGTRHTALVSADSRGMAFSHLATRGLGAVARVVKTARILGRYPVPQAPKDRTRKASSVLGFSSLPLGNVEHPTDSLGLTALLTPYLLVIVSTTPIAETQFKTPRPKEIPPHSTLSGCLAWFPSVKLKRPDPATGQSVSKVKLVYCWSHVLTILDVDAEKSETKDKPPVLHFHPRSRWRSEEAIVAVQWLSRSVLAVLTISQRLVILEDTTLRVTDAFDLIHKQIYHQDIFSAQLRPVVENLDEEDASMHGVVADAFYMSFRAYKGRLFLLGFNDLSLGTLSNWADRLAALIEEGEYIAAIRLAESYYVGDADKITVGLPDDDNVRHDLVREKAIDIVKASVNYVLLRKNGVIQDEDTVARDEMREQLATATFSACRATEELDFLFEDVFEAFQTAGATEIFFRTLEPYVLSEEIQTIPTEVLKSLVEHYASEEKSVQLENLICHMDTRTMDLDQTATLCKRFKLYDALIHVWTQAIGDHVTPLIELMKLLEIVQQEGDEPDPEVLSSAQKIFPYLANVLTGRSYPRGLEVDETVAYSAKKEVYGFLFAGRPIEWPPGSRKTFTTASETNEEAAYPYLALILRFDAASFLSMLNEAFEDHFLNGTPTDGTKVNGHADTTPLPTRQSIVRILLDVMTEDFDDEDAVYLDMFIARNLPKFPQFIILPGKVLDSVIQRLCNYPSEELADDCQLSVEYLLSYYHPSNIEGLTTMFRHAGFFRILKSVYRNARQYSQLVQTFFEDPNDKEMVFDCIADCLRPGSPLTPKHVKEVQSVVLKNARDLVAINSTKAAQLNTQAEESMPGYKASLPSRSPG